MAHKRKRRTREHIIADLSVNHLEYFALKAGFTLEKFDADYGYDAELYTYNDNGEVENSAVYIQLKATDNIESYQLKSGVVSFPIEKKDLELWLKQILPVILVLFDAQKEKAYWLYLQLYFEQKGISLDSIQTDRFSVQLNNIVDSDAIRKWRDYKNTVLSQINGGIKRHV
ncbi:MAG TPA: DUF4365 domain-containing protein [Thiotrichaceae bacterium]|nr:DUF4365 domain-containing protein [Thiotrichaceae bacterium]